MKPKINVLRAVSATVGQRALTFVAIITDTIFILLLVGIWALGYFVSGWWWLLLIIYVPLVVIYLAVYFISRSLLKRLYPKQISPDQKVLLDNFSSKIQHLLEVRGIGWPTFALLNVKDIIFHRQLRTTKNLISDTASLKKDFAELEEKLQSQ